MKNGKIISKGHNDIGQNGRLYREYGLFSIHAECSAILNGGFDGDTLVIVRLLKNNSFASSKPCDKCFSYIVKTNIKKIIYIDADNNVVIERVNESSTNIHYLKHKQWNKTA